MIQTSLSLYEIELALCKSKYFSYLRNIIAFNVNGISSKLGIWHECDMLVLSKNGYLTEIEIKRSWAMRAVMLKEKVVNLQKKIQDESI